MSKKHRHTSLKTSKRDVIVPPMYGTPFTSSLSFASTAFPLTVVEAVGVSAVRRCVTLIANSIAGQRWTEWDGEPPVRLANSHRIIKRPASLMTRREWTWRVVSSMALDDIAYLYMVGGVDDEGVPGSLIPLPKQALMPSGNVDPYGIFAPTQYLLSGVDRPVSAENIIPVRSAFWPGVPPHLIGILQMARNVLMSAHASDNYVSRYWQAGGTPTTQITTDQELTDGQAEGIANRWRDRRSRGPDYPAVLGKGALAQPWGADVSGQLATEARREIVVEVANLFGVPAHYLNAVPTGGSQVYSNVQDEALSLQRFTLDGFADPIQDVISDLLPDERFMLIDMTRLTRASQESRYRAWQIATGAKPWMMPDEVRVEEGLAPNDAVAVIQEAAVDGARSAADSFGNREEAEPVEVGARAGD